MARSLGGFLALFLALSICQAAANFEPISDSHRSAALELFTPTDGSFYSLEDVYEALRVFEILAIEKKPEVSTTTCQKVLENLGSSSPLKDLFYALKVNSLLKCGVNEEVFKDIASRIKATTNDANTLLDLYYSIGSLILIKDHASNVDVRLADADGTFRSIKALGQTDGRWRYSSSNPDASIYAAGLALEALAGVVSLASSEIDHSRGFKLNPKSYPTTEGSVVWKILAEVAKIVVRAPLWQINAVKNDILKLFDRIEYYDDGTFYFDEKIVGTGEQLGSLFTTASVVRGLTAFAAAISEKINLPEDKILGLAKFFLGIGIPVDAKDFFNQVESLAFLESNRVSIPLILSLPATVYSLTHKDQLKVRVNTVLGAAAPPLTVKLVRVFSNGSKGSAVFESKELQYEPNSGLHVLDVFSENVNVGTYVFVFEMVFEDSNRKSDYATGGQTRVPIYITGDIKVGNAEVAILDSDLGSIETQKTLDLTRNGVVSLSANHLAKLRLSFQLTTSHGHDFKPQQAFLKLRHETNVEHIFLVGSTGKKFEIVLDFLGLVEKFYYLSGRYDIELTIGDAVMENSFLRPLGHIELDLPAAPEKAARPPPPPVDSYSIYEPKAEIAHLFRAPEKRPPQNMSLTFLSLTLLPFVGFLVGLLRLGVNLKNFPSATVPATYAILFHAGITAVLFLYLLFWLKLDLFTTLKTLGILGAFLMFMGHGILSHLASSSAKLKSV